ncbi:hypothetical protein [Pontibacillus marinus]|uniref:Uncharacterized protein n=1 Tax=Pontibacillus marinus BH030004 = DSM 16465 TaxID=1385511 RepID=A0A0A5I5D8_9BACI|nr:hypothetical protein [Pontibacillus marinus]KGX91022.1 hypothetical protein N783_13335 [Pontibacillus marinus BH030004 = DSM 16465]
MDLKNLFKYIKAEDTRTIKKDTITKMIQKRLLHLHEVCLWNNEYSSKKLQNVYLSTLPYLVFMGKKLRVRPWNVRVNLTPNFFSQDICYSIAQLYRESYETPDEDEQEFFERIIKHYLSIGLYIGMTPKQIANEFENREDIYFSLNTDLSTHNIKRKYLRKSIQYKRSKNHKNKVRG